MMLYLFDLDGTLISGYMDNPDRAYHVWDVLPGRGVRFDVLAVHGHRVAVVTNQAGVAFGHVAPEDFERKAAAVADALDFAGAIICDSDQFVDPYQGGLVFYVCYGDKRSKDPRYQDDRRRKPSGEMIRQAAAAFGFSLDRVAYVGDRPEDEAAAKDAGVSFQWATDFFGV